MPTITKWVANAQATAQQVQGTVTACPADVFTLLNVT